MSLDPGVRTFMTGYSSDDEVLELGKADIGHICRLCHRMDALQSRWSVKGLEHKKKWQMKRAAAMIRRRIKDLIDDLHCRTAKFLCSSYNLVLLLKFETQQMDKGRGRRRIGSKTARAMATWSHFRFQRRLLNKAREYPWCRVVMVSEAHKQDLRSMRPSEQRRRLQSVQMRSMRDSANQAKRLTSLKRMN
ncbi:hypothetical protein V1522DRAFT_425211 [Lipomyces starkeyi]